MRNDYFVIASAGQGSYPLLGWDQDASPFREGKPVRVSQPIRLRLREPVPARPLMVDHHCLPEPVLSTRIQQVLAPLDLYAVQHVPADVRVGSAVRRYWLLHVFNVLSCMDRKRSVFKMAPDGRTVLRVDKLVLDEKLLSGIPLERRLLFQLSEPSAVYLFHRSLVEQVMSQGAPPDGLRFIPLGAWNDSARLH